MVYGLDAEPRVGAFFEMALTRAFSRALCVRSPAVIQRQSLFGAAALALLGCAPTAQTQDADSSAAIDAIATDQRAHERCAFDTELTTVCLALLLLAARPAARKEGFAE